jgi:putative nucleotidyltransferase with HDIG domain
MLPPAISEPTCSIHGSTGQACVDIWDMHRLSIISDSAESARQISSGLTAVFETQVMRRDRIPAGQPTTYTFVDIDLTNTSNLSDLRLRLRPSPDARVVIFAVDEGDRHQAVQAFALGATALVHRPVDAALLLKKLLGDIGALLGDAATLSNEHAGGVVAGVGALQSVFASACLGTPLDPTGVDQAGGTVVADIEDAGLVHWIDTVRKHHGQTYQHCLLVTGVATAFGQHLGFSSADRRKLAFAGLLHDLGKAKIPLAILEKAGPLDAGETAVMKQHPVLGFEALRDMPGLSPEMLDMVVHHHEYLDGSGYPHGLHAEKLSDFVRLITIADIFGALIERRSYKPPLSGEAAYQVLENMGPKLDKDILRAFRPISRMAHA